jgi:hypothetical protein
LADELANIGTINDLTKKISTVRSRRISMSVIFQNIAQMKNRYPDDAWLEIIGNCDCQLFLGCTDEMTAKFISDRTGEVTIGVESMAKEMRSMRLSNYVPSHRETSSIGKRKLLTPDEVLRLPREDALVIFRGQKVLKVKKFDFTKHPEAKKLRECNARDYIPNWRMEAESPKPAARLWDDETDDAGDAANVQEALPSVRGTSASFAALPQGITEPRQMVRARRRAPKETAYAPAPTESPPAPISLSGAKPPPLPPPLLQSESVPKPVTKPEAAAVQDILPKPKPCPEESVNPASPAAVEPKPTNPAATPSPAPAKAPKRKPGRKKAGKNLQEQLNLEDYEPFRQIDIDDVLSDL